MDNPVFKGQATWRKSLKTTDPTVARVAGVRELAWFEAVVRNEPLSVPMAANEPDELVTPDEGMIRAMAREVYDRELLRWRQRGLTWKGDARGHLEDEYELLAMDAQQVLEESVSAAVDRAERAHSLRLSDDGPERPLMRSAFRVALRDSATAADGIIHREEYFPGPPSEIIATAPLSVSAGRKKTLRVVCDDLLAKEVVGSAWRKKIEDAVTAWEGLGMGELALAEVNQQHIQSYVRLLRQLPANVTKRFPSKSYIDAIAENSRRAEPCSVLSEKTIFDGYVAGIRRVIGHGLDEGIISADPVTRLPKRLSRSVSARDRIFQKDELSALFQHPIFVGCLSHERPNSPGSVLLRDHYYWAPLIALFTGARASEIAQLTVDRSQIQAAIPHISVAALPGGRVKSLSANRLIPLHPILIDLGFGDFVRSQSRAGHVRLFPEWSVSKNDAQQYSSGRVIRNFNEEVVPAVVRRSLSPTFHTLRSNFKTELAIGGVSSQFQNAILGHAQADQDPSYLATLDLETLDREVRKAKFSGVNISHLFPDRRERSKS